MTPRLARVLAGHAVVVVAVLLTACAGDADAAAGAPLDDVAASSEPRGIAPDLVYVTDIDGYELATQSVGILGDEGMSAGYVGSDGTVMLTTGRQATADVPACDELGEAAPAGELRCAVERDGAHVLLTADGPGPDVLRDAGAAVRVPTVDELDGLFGGIPPMHPPVERGDLPAEGDGAPDNSVGPGG